MLGFAPSTRQAFGSVTHTASILRVIPVFSRPFHLTTPLNETYKTRKARADKRKNEAKQRSKKTDNEDTRPDPVLGHLDTPEGRTLWENSELRKILLTESNVLDAQPRSLDAASGPIPLPGHMSFGIKAQEEELIFQTLPEVTAQQRFFIETNAQYDSNTALHVAKLQECESKASIGAIHLARLADLRNASAAGIAVENRRRCVEAFSLPEKPNDTGRSEVQAAILTAQIRNLHAHLKQHTHDIHNRRSLRILVHKRAKILRYLKNTDTARYETVLPRLGLEAAAVEGELKFKRK